MQNNNENKKEQTNDVYLKYVLTWKFPFIKKIPMTRIEIIEKNLREFFDILPILVMIDTLSKIFRRS